MKKENENRPRPRAKKLLREAFAATLPVMAGYLVLGAGFGIILRARRLDPIWALFMSLFIYAGSMQFAALNLISAGASLPVIALTTLLVNARHLFYGISTVDKYKGAGGKKAYMIFALTDETYSLVTSDRAQRSQGEAHRYYFLISLLDQLYWVTGSVLGAALGSLTFIDYTGLDFALTALFVTIFWDQWRDRKGHFPAILGLTAALLCLLIFGKDGFLIPSMLIITAALCLTRRTGGKSRE